MKKINNKILTLDLETRTLSSGKLEVISSAIYDGKNKYTFYILDYKDEETLIKKTLSSRYLAVSKVNYFILLTNKINE